MSLIVSDTGFFPSVLRKTGEHRRRPPVDIESPSAMAADFEGIDAGAIPVGIAAETELAMSNLNHVEGSALPQVLKQYRMV